MQCHYEPFVTLVHNVAGSQNCILTYSMVQSPSWEANWFAASQEIPRISRNPKVHYRTHKRPPPVSILGQPNPVQIPTSHLLQIHPNIIHPSTPRSPQWSPSLRFPHQDPIHLLSSPIRATCPAHLILLDFITRTILGEEYKSFSSRYAISSIPPLPRPSSGHIFSSTPYSQTPSASSPPSMSATKFHIHTKQQAKLQFMYFICGQSCMHAEIKSRCISGKSYFFSSQKFLSFRLLIV